MPSRRTSDDIAPSSHDLMRVADGLRMPVRRQDGKETPIGSRALQTRSKLLEIATEMFAERGYLSTSLGDIAQTAGVSLATVYQYFSDRSDVVAALAGEGVVRLLGASIETWDPGSGRLGLRRAVRSVVAAFHDNRTLLTILRVGTHTDPRLDSLWRDLISLFEARFARSLAVGLKADLVRTDLAPDVMARAMTLALFEHCHDAFVFDPGPSAPGVDETADVLTALWADTIGLVEQADRRRLLPEDPAGSGVHIRQSGHPRRRPGSSR
jgi:AcrR family transcriptional regulator